MMQNNSPTSLADNNTDLNRLYAFSDGVLAIAITLLAFEIQFPEVDKHTIATQFPELLWAMAPKLLGYVQSFIMIGIFWIVHHRIFRYIRRFDMPLLWLNLLFLMCVGFLPVPSSLVMDYLTEPNVMLFYLVCLALTGVVNLGIWLYATQKHRLVDATMEPELIRFMTLRALILPSAALVSLGLYFVWPYLVYAFGYIVMGGFIVLPRLYKKFAGA